MKVKQSQVGWAFWRRWVLTNSVGWGVGFMMAFILTMIIFEDNSEWNNVLGSILIDSTFAVVLGFVVGFMQWVVLRRRISGAVWWLLASTAGIAVGWTIVSSHFEGLGGMGIRWIAAAVFGGAVTGILQWFILRGQVSRAGWWVLASTIGWGLIMAMTIFITEYILQDHNTLQILLLFLSGAVVGVATGVVLIRLLGQPVAEI